MSGNWLSSASRRGARGGAIVEFALILPVFLLIVMMVIDLGRAFSTYEAIANAAREGARAGVISTVPIATVQAKPKGYVLAVGPTPVVTVVVADTALDEGHADVGHLARADLLRAAEEGSTDDVGAGEA